MIDPHLIRNETFERCQFANELQASDGEAGRGIYAYPARHWSRMRAYYASQGEDIWRLTLRPGAAILDLTNSAISSHLLDYARASVQRDVFGGEPPRLRPDNIHRFGSIIERYMAAHWADLDGWLVRHEGPGLPSAQQAVIQHIDAFEACKLDLGKMKDVQSTSEDRETYSLDF